MFTSSNIFDTTNCKTQTSEAMASAAGRLRNRKASVEATVSAAGPVDFEAMKSRLQQQESTASAAAPAAEAVAPVIGRLQQQEGSSSRTASVTGKLQ